MLRRRATRIHEAIHSVGEVVVQTRSERLTPSSEDSDTDLSTETSSSNISDRSTVSDISTSTTDSEDEVKVPPPRRIYHTRTVVRRILNRAGSQSRTREYRTVPRSSNGNVNERRNGTTESEEGHRDQSEYTSMDAEDDDIEIVNERGPYPVNRNARTTPSNSDSELNVVNRPKRRRTINSADQDDNGKIGVSGEVVASSAMCTTVDNDTYADDGCSICYEDYTNAGDHRLASVKCGHFFGYSCITRWIRTEGRNAVCPTCKAKTTIKDVRKHYASAVKVNDTTEVEMLRNSNAALHIRISGLEVDLARRDREISDLMKKLQEGNASGSENPFHPLVVQPRGGRMFMNPERKEALMNGSANADARAMDFNGECWAVGVACSQARNIFCPFGIRMLILNQQEYKLRECYPLHSARSRVVVFSPFESSLILSGYPKFCERAFLLVDHNALSETTQKLVLPFLLTDGGEDKRAIVSINGAIRRQWKMPNEKPVWTGCWTAPNKVVLGLSDGRVLEYAIDSDSTEPLRDYTQGVGHLPIIFTGFDTASSTLLVASFKKLIAFRNDKVFPLLSNAEDQFDKMRCISFHEASLHLAVSLSPGGRHPAISHRLYRLEVDDDNDVVRCVEKSQWLTDCQMSSTMWSNCLFSLHSGLFSVAYNEDKQRFDAHDWSGRRADAMISFPSRSTVAAIRAISTPCESRKTIVVLSDRALFSISFGLSDSTS